jgi:hypothetical protein
MTPCVPGLQKTLPLSEKSRREQRAGCPLVLLDISDTDELAAFQAVNEPTAGAQGKTA